ncbi:Tetratricopeptide repeat protein 5 [Vitis vinifera]|uniref:Tetratricopeptide repeat protein 5 n=1 Tax=Vitis vinifera TaxID=29760 RepID=A0A438JUJ9_VITVI|nr:Tetratricopeptide repeat protein 5 [Vitis vinifera]
MRESKMNEMEELFGEARRAADDLYQLRDTYFPANPAEKISELQRKSDLALSLLDSLPLEQRRLPIQRGTYEFLRGKILDVFPDYRKEAEDHLSKAVKLNPSLADAWLCLGNCIWKKGDLASAKNCFTLALGKGSNKEILCQLSMLERRMAPGKKIFCFPLFFLSHVMLMKMILRRARKQYVSEARRHRELGLSTIADIQQLLQCLAKVSLPESSENQAEIVEESIQHAKEAITLDVKDGNSWYNLGNACLTSFFVTGAWDHSKLLQSLKAYQNAEKDERMKSNPDLYFNCATVNKYLENYERALSGFEAAALKDPGLNAVEEVQKIVDLLNKLESLLKGQARAKRHAALASSRAADNCLHVLFDHILSYFSCNVLIVSLAFYLKVNPSYKRITIDILSEGLNKAVAIVGKVLLFVKHESVAPL